MQTETAKTAAELNAEADKIEAAFNSAYDGHEAEGFDKAAARKIQDAAIAAMNAIAADYASTLVETGHDFKFAECHPSEIKVGDVVAGGYGFAGRVLEVKEYDRENTGKPVYVVKVAYEGGDLYSFRYMFGRRLNGCAVDFRSTIQGNELAKWYKAVNA